MYSNRLAKPDCILDSTPTRLFRSQAVASARRSLAAAGGVCRGPGCLGLFARSPFFARTPLAASARSSLWTSSVPSKDYLVVGSNSGRLVILEYSPDCNRLDKVHQETLGKSGCRRIVPGQPLTVDPYPKGRALCIYVLNRDVAARLTISSPLEAHKSSTLTFSLAALDCGFDSPIFAAIELEYAESDRDPTGQAANQAQKVLTFYELDLGLNHVSRKASEPIDNGANLLVTVPSGGDGLG